MSQTWQGLPGVMVREWQTPNIPTLVAVPCPAPTASPASTDHTYTYVNAALAAGDDITTGSYNLSAAEALCSAHDACMGFTYRGQTPDPAQSATVYFKSALNLNSDTTWSTYAKDYSPPVANLTNWTLGPDGLLRQGAGGVCLDTAGQLPQVNAPNWMRMRACDPEQPGQIFSLLPTGQVVL